MSREPEAAPFRSAEARRRYLAAYDAWGAEWPLPAEERMVSTRYGATFARGSGPPGAPVVVLLPAARATSLLWAAHVAALAANHRVWAIDSIADFGRSVPSRPLQTAEDFVAWLDDLAAALSPNRPFALAGVSYGGWIAARYAAARRERVSALILIAPAGTLMAPRAAFIARALLCLLPLRSFTQSFSRWLSHELATGDGASRALLERHVDRTYLALRCFQPRRPIAPSLLSDGELRQLPERTLFIAGSHDRMSDASAAAARLRSAAPGVRIELIPGAGHDVATARAERVDALLVEHLAAGTRS
jgi:pimeloyl-ACP methyl ester carboxylesterase